MITRISTPPTPEVTVAGIEAEWGQKFHEAPLEVVHAWSEAKKSLVDVEIAWLEYSTEWQQETSAWIIDEEKDVAWGARNNAWRIENEIYLEYREAKYKAEYGIPSGNIVNWDKSTMLMGGDDLYYHINRLWNSDNRLHRGKALKLAKQIGRNLFEVTDGK